MFEISELKAKKLPELQEIAKTLRVPKYRTQKKLDLVYQILDYQAANPKKVQEALTDEDVKPQPQEDKTPERISEKPVPEKRKPILPKSSGDKRKSSDKKSILPEENEGNPKKRSVLRIIKLLPDKQERSKSEKRRFSKASIF